MVKIKEFWKKYEQKIILLTGFILISTSSFEAGFLKGQELSKTPIIIEKPHGSQPQSKAVSESQNTSSKGNKARGNINAPESKCAFVGSKNSNKFHVPTCQWAKRIKPENLVCFETIEDAERHGKIRHDCIK